MPLTGGIAPPAGVQGVRALNGFDLIIVGAVMLLSLMWLKSGILKPVSGIGGLFLGSVLAIGYSAQVATLLVDYIDGEMMQRVVAYIAIVLSVAIASRLAASLIRSLLSSLTIG